MYPTRTAGCVARVALYSWRFIVPLTVFVVCYWKIISSLRRNAKVGNIGQTEQHTAGPSTSAAANAAATDASSRSKPLSKTQKNVIKTMIAVTCCFIVCWAPVQFQLVGIMCGLRAFSSFSVYYALVLAVANFSANPFIYATGLRVKCTTILDRLGHHENQVMRQTSNNET